ncbi:MAG: hypothetical protein KBD25_00785 [Rickettsiaceae bacterium]|nr:hypothetical protein [Rickettsiaceae bacterium]
MIEQLKTEIKSIRTPLTLTTLISAYILFISLSVVTGELFLGLFFGTFIALFVLMRLSTIRQEKIMDKIKIEFNTENTIVVDSSISFFKSTLFVISYFIIIKLCLIIAPHSTNILASVAISFSIISMLLIGINGAYDWKKIGKYKPSNGFTADEYIGFPELNIESPRSDTWHSDPCIPGNPIYVKH